MALHQEFSNGLILAWPTPILSRRVEDPALLDGLKELVLQKEVEDPAGMKRALVNGWHSKLDLMEWSGAPVQSLKQVIGDQVQDYLRIASGGKTVIGTGHITAWANISRRGGYHRLHTHHSSMLAGVLYLDAGVPDPDDTENNGCITFDDPRTGVEMIPLPGNPFGDKVRFDPAPGMLLLFPSWLKHFVDPFRGEGARISIAFNVMMPDARIEDAPAGEPKERETP